MDVADVTLGMDKDSESSLGSQDVEHDSSNKTPGHNHLDQAEIHGNDVIKDGAKSMDAMVDSRLVSLTNDGDNTVTPSNVKDRNLLLSDSSTKRTTVGSDIKNDVTIINELIIKSVESICKSTCKESSDSSVNFLNHLERHTANVIDGSHIKPTEKDTDFPLVEEIKRACDNVNDELTSDEDKDSVHSLQLTDVDDFEPMDNMSLEDPSKEIRFKTEWLNDDLDVVRRLSSSKIHAKTSANFSIDLLDDVLVAKTEIYVDDGSISSRDICEQMETKDGDGAIIDSAPCSIPCIESSEPKLRPIIKSLKFSGKPCGGHFDVDKEPVQHLFLDHSVLSKSLHTQPIRKTSTQRSQERRARLKSSLPPNTRPIAKTSAERSRERRARLRSSLPSNARPMAKTSTQRSRERCSRLSLSVPLDTQQVATGHMPTLDTQLLHVPSCTVNIPVALLDPERATSCPHLTPVSSVELLVLPALSTQVQHMQNSTLTGPMPVLDTEPTTSLVGYILLPLRTPQPTVPDIQLQHIHDHIHSNPHNSQEPSSRYSASDANKIANSPRYLQPFQHGWKREIVLHAEITTNKPHIYYFSPSGKKLKTRLEIEKYLTENKINNVSADNFIFARLRLNSPNDSIRKAVRKGNPPNINNMSLESNVLSLEKGQPPNKKQKSDPVSLLQDTFKESSLTIVNNDVPKMVRRCTNLCPGQEGILPSVNCNKCLCLFHPGCFGISNSFAGSSNFTCQECGLLDLDPLPVTVNSLNIPATFSIPEDHRDSGKMKHSSHGPAELTSSSISVISTPKPSSSITKSPNSVLVKCRPPNPTESASIDGAPKNLLRAVIVPSSGGAFPLLKTAIMKRTAPMRPPVARRSLCNRHQITANPGNRTHPTLVDTSKIAKSQCPPLVSKPDQESLAETEQSYNKIQRSTVKTQPTANNSLSALNCGILSLISIFKYLGVRDLLRVSEVCQGWHMLARHPTLWEKVALKNVKIKDWKAFLVAAKRLGVRHLDTIEMVVNDNFEGFINAINELMDLEGLRLGVSPLSVTNMVVSRLPHLKCFSAEWIIDSNKSQPCESGICVTIDIDKFAAMSQLESLRLRGLNGLRLPPSNTCLERLGSLKNLSCLAMTSMKHMSSAQFEFLFILSNLKTLELGECVNWKEGVYAAISRLKKLQNLRLEFGGEYAEHGIQTILPALLNLVKLELIIFSLPSNLGNLLSPLKKLQQLTVWPDLKYRPEQNNYFMVKATKQCASLKIMMWGLVTSHLTNPQLNLPGRIDHNSVCIPFLNCDPPPLISPRPSTKINISAHDLMKMLRKEIPHSKVQVIMVPNELYSTLCYMPR